MKSGTLMTVRHGLLILVMYAFGVFVLGLAAFPGLILIYKTWTGAPADPAWSRLLALSFSVALGYFVFGFSLIIIVSLIRLLLRLDLKEGTFSLSSPQVIKWMFINALFLSVKATFMDFILLTPYCSFLYNLLGAKVGSNVQINSKNVADFPLLEVGDNSVIGGNATIISHSFEKNGLNLAKVRIGNNVIIGLNSIVMPGSEIGDGSVIAAGAVLPKGTKVAPGSVYLGNKDEAKQ